MPSVSTKNGFCIVTFTLDQILRFRGKITNPGWFPLGRFAKDNTRDRGDLVEQETSYSDRIGESSGLEQPDCVYAIGFLCWLFLDPVTLLGHRIFGSAGKAPV